MDERALTLQEVADLLHVSRRTVYEHRDELGFFQVGSAWRVWPEKLREATTNAGAAKPAREVEQLIERPNARQINASLSARNAASELDKLLAQRAKKKRGN
ncbi:hypothetical protein PT2222_50009 [Paraburkholderia tropica]